MYSARTAAALGTPPNLYDKCIFENNSPSASGVVQLKALLAGIFRCRQFQGQYHPECGRWFKTGGNDFDITLQPRGQWCREGRTGRV